MLNRRFFFSICSWLFISLYLIGCQKLEPADQAADVYEDEPPGIRDESGSANVALALEPIQTAESTSLPAIPNVEMDSTSAPPPSPTAVATLTPVPATPIPSPTPIGPCDARQPQGDLLTIVTNEFGISRDYAPDDLVPLADHLPYSVTSGYPSEIRQVAIEPLVNMIDAMLAAGLFPRIESGYRSYAAQAIAWDKWNREYPESAAIVSALPGHSEHQLGTVVDFGSPELAAIVGQEDIEFHTYFYKTSEGQWLDAHAHEYGFTLSFSLEAFEITGLYYEPWHYRYIGPEMAKLLKNQGTTLIEYQLAAHGAPCIP